MAEDEGKIEPSGLAPGPEVPDEERFLSSEKQYPTKEKRIRAVEEARNPKQKPELPHVPPFIETSPSKPNWQPVPEPEPERLTRTAERPDTIKSMAQGESSVETQTPVVPTEHLEPKGGAATLKRILKEQEAIEKTKAEESPIRASIPEEAKAYRTVFEKEPVRQFTQPPTAEQKIRQQIQQAPREEAPKPSFFARLWNSLTGK